MVNHKTHVRFVDAHAKGNRGTNNLNLIADEGLLIFGACCGIESGVIRGTARPCSESRLARRSVAFRLAQ